MKIKDAIKETLNETFNLTNLWNILAIISTVLFFGLPFIVCFGIIITSATIINLGLVLPLAVIMSFVEVGWIFFWIKVIDKMD